MEPEICTKMLKKLSENSEQNFLPLHMANPWSNLPLSLRLRSSKPLFYFEFSDSKIMLISPKKLNSQSEKLRNTNMHNPPFQDTGNAEEFAVA